MYTLCFELLALLKLDFPGKQARSRQNESSERGLLGSTNLYIRHTHPLRMNEGSFVEIILS